MMAHFHSTLPAMSTHDCARQQFSLPWPDPGQGLDLARGAAEAREAADAADLAGRQLLCLHVAALFDQWPGLARLLLKMPEYNPFFDPEEMEALVVAEAFFTHHRLTRMAIQEENEAIVRSFEPFKPWLSPLRNDWRLDREGAFEEAARILLTEAERSQWAADAEGRRIAREIPAPPNSTPAPRPGL